MKATIILLVTVVLITLGCASTIVTGEGVRTSLTVLKSKASDSEVSIFMIDSNIDRPYEEIGLVFSRAWVFEKGLEELKNQARKLGADAVVCEFRTISTSHFGRTRPPVSDHRDHLFRSDRDHFGVTSERGGRDSEMSSKTCLGERMSDAG